MKRQAIEWEKVFAKHISDKGLVSKIHKAPLQLKKRKQITQSKNGQNSEQTPYKRIYTDG